MRKLICIILLLSFITINSLPTTVDAASNKDQEIVTEPTGFSWSYPIEITKNGNKYSTNFDVTKLRPTKGVTYYVDVNKGSDNSEGTASKPLKSIHVALKKPGVGTVYVADGLYSRKTGFNEFKIQNDVSIIAQGKNAVITTQDVLTWTPVGNGVFKATRSGISRVLDSKFTDKNGDYFELLKVEKIDQLIAGSYFTNATEVYVKTKDGRSIDSKIIATLSVRNLQVESGATVYVEGLKLYGGLYAASVRNTGNGKDPILYAKNIEMKYSHKNQNGLNVLGAKLTIIQNSLAAHNGNDGFNYHSFNGVIPKAIEIDCVGRNNGQESDTDNGSTIHDGGSIIRLNGKYYENIGPNIADVDDNTQSWNIGVSSYGSKAKKGVQNADFQNKDGKALVWLENCIAYGSQYSVFVDKGTTYKKGGKFETESGDIVTY